MIGDWSIRAAHPSYSGGKHGLDREPKPLPAVLFPPGSVEVQRAERGSKEPPAIVLHHEALSNLLLVLRRRRPDESARCWRALLTAMQVARGRAPGPDAVT